MFMSFIFNVRTGADMPFGRKLGVLGPYHQSHGLAGVSIETCPDPNPVGASPTD